MKARTIRRIAVTVAVAMWLFIALGTLSLAWTNAPNERLNNLMLWSMCWSIVPFTVALCSDYIGSDA
jgi:hypothetical protein